MRRQQEELARAQAELLRLVEEWEHVRADGAAAERGLADLAARRRALETARADLDRAAQGQGQTARAAALSMEELRARGKRVADEIAALQKAPSAKHTLRYQTPVSAPVQTEELLFECKAGRVTLIDIGALLDEVKHGMQARVNELKTRWELSDTTAPVGPFRLSYTVERQNDLPGLAGTPTPNASFRYGVSSWQVIPVQDDRGETADAALKPGSAFRGVAEGIDAQQTAVTFWVYPDSFAVYRRLRDFLHERDVVVAGRPLPDGQPIASSKRGTASRGQ
jgi:hypothetical protein